jgi:hypothetical protein
MGQWRYSFTILDHGTAWQRVVSFMPWLLYLCGKSLWYPSNRRLGGTQSLSEHYGGEKNFATARN